MAKVPGDGRSMLPTRIQPSRTKVTKYEETSFFSVPSVENQRSGDVNTQARSFYKIGRGDNGDKLISLQPEQNNSSQSESGNCYSGGSNKNKNSGTETLCFRKIECPVRSMIQDDMEHHGDILMQNPRILDLRNKLNEIKKRDHDIDKETKTMYNDLTQQLREGINSEDRESGPYSLLMELKSPDLDESLESTEIQNAVSFSEFAVCSNATDMPEKVNVDFSLEIHHEPLMTSTPVLNNVSRKSFLCRNNTGMKRKDHESITDPSHVNRKAKLQYGVRPYDNISKLKGPMEKNSTRVLFADKSLNEFEYSCLNDQHMDDFGEHSIKSNDPKSKVGMCLNLNKPHNSSTSRVSIQIDALSPNQENATQRVNDEHSLDDSLGILTPDQMDDLCFLENAFSPTVEALPEICSESNSQKVSPSNSETPSTEKNDSNSAVSTMFMDKSGILENDKNISSPMIGGNYFGVKNTEIDNACVQNSSNQDSTLTHNLKMGPFPQISKTISIETPMEIGITEDELLPSVHSSILDPNSSAIDTTVNLDLSLDSKLYEQNIHGGRIHRIDATPSPEELPLDPTELTNELTSYNTDHSDCPLTLHDSQTDSEPKTDFVKSMETSKVSNSFITSITSVTSLDGYQGDGEMSRPVSRGADQSPINRHRVSAMEWQNVPVNRRPDPMTDSDFFTESDADDQVHRRAQVIDGALYGGNNVEIRPVIVNRNEDSCMESSGVYTDLETHRSSPLFMNAIVDLSPGGSSPSTHSECSQKKQSNQSKANLSESLNDTVVAIKRNDIAIDPDNTFDELKSSRKSSLEKEEHYSKRNSLDKAKDEKRSFALKKYKMPKRDVQSKVMTMLTARKPDSNEYNKENGSMVKPCKKMERRDMGYKKTIMDKNDVKLKSYKEVKSKVDSSFSLQRSQTTCSVSRIFSSKSPNINQKNKSRHLRSRLPDHSVTGSSKSSLHSSQSDISASSTPMGKAIASRFMTTRAAKKREPPAPAPSANAAPPAQRVAAPPPIKKNVVPLAKLSGSPTSVRARAPAVAVAAAPAAATPRKATPRRTPSTASTRPTTTPVKEQCRVGPGAGTGKAASVRAPPAKPSPPPIVQPPNKSVEALGVLVQYLVFQLDGLNAPRWRAEAARWRSAAARSSLDARETRQKDLDTIASCLTRVSHLEREVAAGTQLHAACAEAEARYRHALADLAGLAGDISALKTTIDNLKREVRESRERLCAQSERERELRAELDEARAQLAEAAEAQRAAEHTARQETRPTTMEYNESMVNDQTVSFVSASVESTDLTIDTSQDALSVGTALDMNGHANSTSEEDQVGEEEEKVYPRGGVALQWSRSGTEIDDTCKTKEELSAEVQSLRAVLELKQMEACELRRARERVTFELEARAAAEREARALRAANEELAARLDAYRRDSAALAERNERLRETCARDAELKNRLDMCNEELRYKLRQKSQVVNLLAVQGGVGGGAGAYLNHTYPRIRPERRSERHTSCGDADVDNGDSPEPSDSPPASPPVSPAYPAASPSPTREPAVKAVVEKQDSVSWVLEIEESPEEVATRLSRRSGSFRAGAEGGRLKRRGVATPSVSPPSPRSPALRPATAPPAPSPHSKVFRCGSVSPPSGEEVGAEGARPLSVSLEYATSGLKESAGEAIYIYDNRQF